MSTAIRLKCEACGGDALLQTHLNISDVLVTKIQAADPCPVCGGGLSSPGGFYRKNAHDLLVRIGEFTPPTPALN